MRNGFKSILIVAITTLVLAVPAHAQTAPALTQADLNRLEARIDAQVANLTAPLVAQNLALLQRLNTTQARIVAIQGNLTEVANAGRLVDARALMVSLGQLANFTTSGNLAEAQGRNDTLQDHLQIYKALIGPDGKPILAALSTQVDQLTFSQTKLRGDFAALNQNVTSGFNTGNKANEQVWSSTDQVAGQTRMIMYLAWATILINLIVFSWQTKRPKALWARIRREAHKTDHRGVVADPDCPEDSNGMKFGEYHGCDFRAKCPVGELCRKRANDMTQQAIIVPKPGEEEPGLAAAEADSADGPTVVAGRAKRPDRLSGFGG